MNATRDFAILARRAFADSLPVLVGYGTMGFVAGVLLAAKGGVSLSPLWAALTSASCVSGTFNYAIVMPVAARASLFSIAMMTLGINFRYAFYGFALIERWKGLPLIRKLFLIHMMTDENFALVTSCPIVDRQRSNRYAFLLSLMNFSYWVIAVTIGALAVVLLERAFDPETIRAHTRGMEFTMVALFLVILTDQVRGFISHGK